MNHYFQFILQRYILEILITTIFLWWVKSLLINRSVLILIWVSNKLEIRFIKNFLQNYINNNKVFALLETTKDVIRHTKYIKNPTYRDYGGIIFHYMFNGKITMEKLLIDDLYNNSLLKSNKEVVDVIHKHIVSDRLSFTTNILSCVNAGLMDKTFANKFLVWVDVFFQSLENHVLGLKRTPNVIPIIIEYLNILYDFTDIFIINVPHVINSLNGSIKDKLKQSEISNKYETIDIFEEH